MPSGTTSKTKEHLLIYLLLSITIIAAALNVAHLWNQTSNPSETSNPESLFILHAVHLADAKPLYNDFRNPPYNVTPYTPVYYSILAAMKKSFSLDLQQLFVRGRQLMVVVTLAIAGLLFWNGIRTTNSKILSLFTALLFLGSYILWPSACTNRPDLLAVLCSLAGVIVVAHDERRGLYFSIPLFVVAFYTKQSFLSAPAAIFMYLLLQKRYRSALIFSATFGLSIALIWVLLHQITNGMSTLNIAGSNIAPMKFFNMRLVAAMALQSATLLFILSFSGLTRDFWKYLTPTYFLFSLVWALLTSAKAGSAANYFIEPLAAGCLLIPEALRRSLYIKGPARTLLVAVFIILMLPQINFMTHSLRALNFKSDESAKKLASEARGLVISDNPRISIASKRPFFVEPFPYSYLEKKGKWDSAELLSLIKHGRIEYFIMTNPFDHPLTWQGLTRLPSSVLQAANAEYKLANRVDGYYVYIHK